MTAILVPVLAVLVILLACGAFGAPRPPTLTNVTARAVGPRIAVTGEVQNVSVPTTVYVMFTGQAVQTCEQVQLSANGPLSVYLNNVAPGRVYVVSVTASNLFGLDFAGPFEVRATDVFPTKQAGTVVEVR